MPTPVVMPQMGESIAEGTIVRWMKKVGDSVDRDEPLFEISTDKVDAEIPSPAAGVLTDISVPEGETVPVNSVVATISAEGEAAAVPPPAAAAKPATQESAGKQSAAASTQSQGDGGGHARAAARTDAAAESPADAPRQRSSPLVRRIAKEHNVDVSQIQGSGSGGRVTKNDILGFLQEHPDEDATSRPAGQGTPDRAGGERVEIRPLSVMRKKIAEHMVLSRRTSAHVHTVFQVNFATVDRIRKAHKAAYESRGAKLTYMSFIAKAVVDALRRHPIVNASLDGENVVYKKDINLGVAVALDNGLIVPVIRKADEKNLLGLSRAINDLAARARAKKLNPEEVQHGTFTITNPGIFGALYGLPLINQPQVAILGVGTIEKRAVVIDDAIAIKPMCHLSLGYDHRLIDGADGGRFLTFVKERLEAFEEGWM